MMIIMIMIIMIIMIFISRRWWGGFWLGAGSPEGAQAENEGTEAKVGNMEDDFFVKIIMRMIFLTIIITMSAGLSKSGKYERCRRWLLLMNIWMIFLMKTEEMTVLLFCLGETCKRTWELSTNSLSQHENSKLHVLNFQTRGIRGCSRMTSSLLRGI